MFPIEESMNFWRRAGYERLEEKTLQRLEGGERAEGLVRCWWRLWIVRLATLPALGLPYLALQYFPSISSRLTFSPAPLHQASHLLIKNREGEEAICRVEESPMRHFVYKCHRYGWSLNSYSFVLLTGLQGSLHELLHTSDGLSLQQRHLRLQMYGPNKIYVESASVFKLCMNAIMNPFYLFEIFSVFVWIFDDYYQYAICVSVMSIVSIIFSSIQLKKQKEMLREMVIESDKNYFMVQDENGKYQMVSSEDLVPGDILLVPPHGCLMTCDALLLTGTCIVNEASLTGEGTPITKFPGVPLDEEYHPSSVHSRHTLFCGTKIVQTRFYHHDQVTALVVRTGTMTAKGQLIRSILFPKPVGFDFHRDSIRFILIMFAISFIGCAFTLYLYALRGAGLETTLLRVLDIITVVVPPALPAAITVGTAYSQSRLKKKGIFCTSPPRINVAGKVKLVCFDKTGTLTEEGLCVWGVLTGEGGSLSRLVDQPEDLPPTSPVLQAMASCHSLTTIDGALAGDPLDLSMFSATSWVLEEPGKEETNRYDSLSLVTVAPSPDKTTIQRIPVADGMDIQVRLEVGIVRQFPFNSTDQRMSVITRQLGLSHMAVYTKGSPERVIALCQPSSLPDNLAVTLAYYTSSGFRVIALAYKKLPRKFKLVHAQRAKREQIECDLVFLGVLIMQNRLKPQSASVIRQLQDAKIKCLMVTGDSMLTAVSVSRDCGLLAATTPMSQVIISRNPEEAVQILPLNSSIGAAETDVATVLAVDGPTWAEIRRRFPCLLPMIATRGVVFARMSPRQKSEVIETLQSLDYIVAMVGDGANDCGALKTAHVGISLSQAEASIAAPFTSAGGDVTCVTDLINEGRCSLVTSFGLFNFMMLYSITQFSSVVILYMRGVEMSTMEFLFVDLVVTGVLAVGMGHAGPGHKLSLRRPTTGLSSPANVVPLLLQMALTVLVQIASLHLLQYQSWYRPVEGGRGDEEVITCWENSSVYLVSCFQYTILAVACSKGRPHRQSFHRNWLMVGTVVALTLVETVLLITPHHWLTDWFELEPPSQEDLPFRLALLLLPLLQLVLSLLIEGNVANSRWFKWIQHKVQGKKQFKNRYKTVEQQILAVTQGQCHDHSPSPDPQVPAQPFWDPLPV